MSNSEIYVKLYATLETAIRQKYGYDQNPILKASENELSNYKEELNTLRNFRNVLSHSKPFGIEYCAEPHEKLLKTLKMILEEVDDTLLIKHCVRIGNVKYANASDKVLDYMNAMHENIYTHIPILDDKKHVVGIFGESTLFSLVLDLANQNDLLGLDDETTFNDIKEYIKLGAHETEQFCFMSKYSTILDCHYEFKKIFEGNKKRLGMIFVTENGRPDEGLLGILTAWGILGREV